MCEKSVGFSSVELRYLTLWKCTIIYPISMIYCQCMDGGKNLFLIYNTFLTVYYVKK